MKKHILLTCVSLLVSLLSISASIEVRSTHMTTTDGLANNSICYIFQDSKGFIWMGTLNGLSRYDGNSFITFLPESESHTNTLRRVTATAHSAKSRHTWVVPSDNQFLIYSW